MSLTSGNNVFDLRIAAVVYVVGSVTRWLQHVLNIWPFRTTRICSKLQIFCQSRLKIWPIPNWCSYKLPKTLNFLPKWWNFAKSRHTGGRPFDTFVCGGRMQYCKLDKNVLQPTITEACIKHSSCETSFRQDYGLTTFDREVVSLNPGSGWNISVFEKYILKRQKNKHYYPLCNSFQ